MFLLLDTPFASPRSTLRGHFRRQCLCLNSPRSLEPLRAHLPALSRVLLTYGVLRAIVELHATRMPRHAPHLGLREPTKAQSRRDYTGAILSVIPGRPLRGPFDARGRGASQGPWPSPALPLSFSLAPAQRASLAPAEHSLGSTSSSLSLPSKPSRWRSAAYPKISLPTGR